MARVDGWPGSPGGRAGWPLAIALACVALGAGAGAGDVEETAEPEVRFARPRARSTVVGPTSIVLAVYVPEGATAAQVEIRVDGRQLAVLTEPPWEVDWNAGPEGRAHTLEARLRLTDGREARGVVHTSALRIDTVEKVDLVNLYLVVRDRSGGHVLDLAQRDFEVVEDGVPQTITRFAASRKPLRVAIVLDSSQSMIRGGRLEKAQKAALTFLDVLEPGDEAAVVDFNDRVKLPETFTSDRAVLAQAIEAAVPAGGTALYDAIWKTTRLLDGFDDRKAIVLLSDGRDEAANGLEPGSLHTIEEALDRAHRAETMIFPIGLGRDLDKTFVRLWDRLSGRSNLDPSTSLADLLRRLAKETGGRAVMSSDASGLRNAFDEIAQDLRHQYSIAYASTNAARDGKWRDVGVRVPGRNVELLARHGYYAPDDRKENGRRER